VVYGDYCNVYEWLFSLEIFPYGERLQINLTCNKIALYQLFLLRHYFVTELFTAALCELNELPRFEFVCLLGRLELFRSNFTSKSCMCEEKVLCFLQMRHEQCMDLGFR